MSITIATAPDSWGVWFADDPRQTPWNRFLDEVVVAGYEWIELGPYGYLPPDPDRLRPELERRGLRACAAVAMGHLEDPDAWTDLEQQIVGDAELLTALGGQFLVLIDDLYTNLFTGEQQGPERLDSDAWQRLVETTNRAADIAHDRYGLSLVFHPHAQTHVQYEDQIEALLDQTDPARVSLCFDVGHHAYCGGEPISFLRKHHARIPYLHLKSVDRDMQRQVESEGVPFAKAVERGVFCEPALGAVDFLALRDLLSEIGYAGWGTVEQDMYPAPFDKPLPIAKRTREYLCEIGVG